jgi:outer membrane protein TolC
MSRSKLHAWPLCQRLLSCALMWVATLPALAVESPGADLASVRAWAIAANPELAATELDAQAARARVVPAGALPDPMLGVTLRDIDPAAPWRGAGRMTGNLVQWRQTVLLWGKRTLAREVASAEADAADADHTAAARRLLADVETAYARYWEAGEAVAVIGRRLALIEQVEQIAGVRYAVGLAPQQDAIRAQVVRTQLAADRLERDATQHEAAATLNALLARPADAPLARPTTAPELPVRWTTLATARAALTPATQPELAARTAMASAAERTAELQRRNRRPDVTLGLGAMQRGNGVESLELMLEVEIPLQQRARREREREADLRAQAARLRAASTGSELEGRLAGALAQWTTARERRRLAETTLRVQSDANFKSAIAGYQTGEVDFATVLDALDAWQGAELTRLAAQRDELIAAATVRAVEGAP